MDATNVNISQVLIPIGTLIIGYLLNALKGALDFSMQSRRIRSDKRESVYKDLFTKLFILFRNYRDAIISSSLRYVQPDNSADKTAWDISGNIVRIINDEFGELEDMLYAKSLLIDANIFEALLKIPKLFSGRLLSYEEMKEKFDLKNLVQFETRYSMILWNYALTIMNKVRKNIGLDKYPQNYLALWDKAMSITDADFRFEK